MSSSRKKKVHGLKKTSSLESASSTASSQSVRQTRGPTEADTQGKEDQQLMFDVVCLVMFCYKHQKIAVKSFDDKGYFLPSFKYNAEISLNELFSNFLKKVYDKKASLFKVSIITMRRIQVPQMYNFVHVPICLSELTNKNINECICTSNGPNVYWHTYQELNYINLLGPEPKIFHIYMMKNEIELSRYEEYSIKDILKLLYNNPSDQQISLSIVLFKNVKLTEKHLLAIYSDFVFHTFPSLYMNQASLANYLTKVGWQISEEEAPRIYKAFDREKTVDGISFESFLVGLCVTDKTAEHREIRLSFVFRYYDQDDDKLLNYEEFKRVIYDALKTKNESIDDDIVEKEVYQTYVKLGLSFKSPINEEQFKVGVGELKIRGTSSLFRAPFRLLSEIKKNSVYKPLEHLQQTLTASEAKISRLKGTCLRCREKRYTIASHIVTITPEGMTVDPIETNENDCFNISRDKRSLSKDAFYFKTAPNVILETLRDFAESGQVPGLKQTKSSRTTKVTKNWSNKATRDGMFDMIYGMCSQVEAIFKKEPRVLKTNSPCYVLGDIHGNFHDLIMYERCLCKGGPNCVPSNFLFLGDYVDRGEFSIEVILYLFAFKVNNPDKFLMIRGNHEVRVVSMSFTFKRECEDKFTHGRKLWELLNQVFDHMPLCAVIDETIFCAHGGIPASATKIEEILKIPVPLSHPQSQSQVAWEILWNDPISTNEFNSYFETMTGQASAMTNLPGFLNNTKRGTAYYFSEEAFNKFCQTNGITHMIRGHEVTTSGYGFHLDGKIVTIFSSSRYCNGLNESACALVDQEKIRILKMDTRSND